MGVGEIELRKRLWWWVYVFDRKIPDLDRGLRVWNQNLKANGILFDIGNTDLQHSSGDTNHSYESTTMWLQLMANITMTLIHRPGLSFDDTTPEFGNCLRECLDSGSAILSLVEASNIPKWLRNLSLVGPATIFQSALVHIYSQLKYCTFKPDGFPGLDTSMGMISKGISILTMDSSRATQVQGSIYSESLNEIVKTLRTLLSSLPVAQGLVETPHVVDDGVPISDAPDTFDEQNWSGNALDALNYMTASDWMGDPSGPFMGFMDLGES
ncbi:hypothetical protein PEXP_002700 [Penicillium expansum]|nr:hypothetical protein PEXP_002700 [Penicillium expansum]